MKKKKRRILWKKVFLYLLGIALVWGALYVYFKTGFFTIRSYEIIGVDEKYIPTLTKEFEDLDKQKIYKVFPSNRVITFHKRDIKSDVLKLLPNTSSVST